MGSYILKATNLSSEDGTIVADVGFNYTDNLNDINEAEIKISGTGTVKRSLLEIGSEIEISRNGTLEFLGKIDNLNNAEGGTVTFHATGYEFWLAKENGDYANSPWTATASATIFGDIIGESNYFTAGTVEAGFSIDFRLVDSQSLWNALANLAKKTTQDIQLDYANKEVDILDHRGSSTSVGTFNDGINIRNVRVNYAYPLGNHIKVYGKGDGVDQIKGEAEDATSISTYGRIKREITDRSIMTTAEAGKLADAELALTKDIVKIIDFDFNNPNENVNTGDIITLNAVDLSNESVRIVGLTRGMQGDREILTAQVTNPAFKQLIRRRNKIIAQLQKDNIDQSSYMQGSGNLSQWKGLINGNNSAGLRFTFNIGDSFEDEAGNLRVDSLTLDYDVDKYRRGVGTATESNKDPNIDSGTFSGQDNVSTEVDVDTTFNNVITFADSWTSYKSWTNISQHGEAIIFHLHLWVVDWNNPTSAHSAYGRIKHVDETDYYPNTTGIRLLRGVTEEATDTDQHTHNIQNDTHNHQTQQGSGVSKFMTHEEDTCTIEPDFCEFTTGNDTHNHTADSDTHDHQAYNQLNGTGTIYVPLDPYNQDFDVELDHSDSGNATAGIFFAYYVVSQHKHGSGDYKTDLHKHDVAVGDAVSDAGSINATEVNIYLDFWNGSAWINKHSILGTGKTLDTDVDITNSGTYPDAKGYWRVRILTDNASPDLIQGIVNVKHALDN